MPGRFKETYIRLQLGGFEIDMNAKPSPDWEEIGVQPDIAPIHSYRLLFAISADTKFLIADRFDNWFLDFFTAQFAMYALACTNRCQTLEGEGQPEAVLWKATDALLFGNCSLSSKVRALRRAMQTVQSPWSKRSGMVLLRAGKRYRDLLELYGIDVERVAALARTCWKKSENRHLRPRDDH